MDDDEYVLIAEAMKLAYDDYALQLSDDDTIFSDDECNVECSIGDLSETKCTCTNCGDSCCFEATTDKSWKVNILPLLIMHSVLCFIQYMI